MYDLIRKLEQLDSRLLVVLGFTLIGALGILDYATGSELAFSIFYLLPIALLAYFLGRRIGVIASILCAVTWFMADRWDGVQYSHAAIPYWNTAVRFAFFLIVTWLLTTLHTALHREKKLARTDYLTGAVNNRSFYETLQTEMHRSERYGRPFSLAYLDVDNFKQVNDQWGHSAGDVLLRTIVDTVTRRLRQTDVIARLGGDEFAVLLPETDADQAQVIMARLRCLLLEVVQAHGWPVSFSIGMVTCLSTPSTVDELVRLVDITMYDVKGTSKNAIKHKVLRADAVIESVPPVSCASIMP